MKRLTKNVRSLILISLLTVTLLSGCRHVDTLSLDPQELTLKVGGTPVKLSVAVPSDTKEQAAVWSSSDISVVSVDATGVVRAVGPGSAKISVSVPNFRVATCQVTVLAVPVTGITLNVPKHTFYVGSLPSLITVIVSPDDAADKEVVWSSSHPAVATVERRDGSDYIVPYDVGETEITASSQDGAYLAACKVVVRDRPFIPQRTIAAGPQDRWKLLSSSLLSVERESGGVAFYDIGGTQAVLLFEVDASNVSRLVYSAWGEYAMAYLKFSLQESERDGLYVIDYRSRSLRKLEQFAEDYVTFSPQSDLVAFYSAYGAGSSLTLARVQATGAVETLHHHAFAGTSLSKVQFIDDSLLGIVVEHRTDDWSATWELYTWNLSTQEITKQGQFQVHDTWIKISPDNKSWAFGSMPTSKWAIWQPRSGRLSAWMPAESTPTGVIWSQDGTNLLLFTASPHGTEQVSHYSIDLLGTPVEKELTDIYLKGWIFGGYYDYHSSQILLEPYLSHTANSEWQGAVDYIGEFYQRFCITSDLKKIVYYDAHGKKIAILTMRKDLN